MERAEILGNAFLAATAKIIASRLRDRTVAIQVQLPDDPILQRNSGCFVSLHRTDNHMLRGCIGVVESPKPLREAFFNAAESVLNDPRFTEQPVTAAEIEMLDVEVTVLGPLQPAVSPLDFDPKIHGICLNVLGKSGLFLPQVARETGWNRQQLLARLCSEKLGLPPEIWRHPSAQMRTFTADVIGPKPMRELL